MIQLPFRISYEIISWNLKILNFNANLFWKQLIRLNTQFI